MNDDSDTSSSLKIHVSCSLCNELNGWYENEELAKRVLIKHLKKAHKDIYNPMKLSIERQFE